MIIDDYLELIEDYYERKLFTIGYNLFEKHSNGGRDTISKSVLETLSNEELEGLSFFYAIAFDKDTEEDSAHSESVFNCIYVMADRIKDFDYKGYLKWLRENDREWN